jgi:uncharacterized membrane protein YfcA
MKQNALKNRLMYEGLITALAVGGFFIILGFVIAFTPDIVHKTDVFFGDLTNVTYQVGSSTVNLPAPANPAAHIGFFTAVMNFLLGVGILQIAILALRFAVRSPIRRIGATVGNMVFWLGAAVVANVFLLAGTLAGWFQFWALLIILIGLSLLARFSIYLAKRPHASMKQSRPQ